MSKRNVYTVNVTAIISGVATYSCPEGAKIWDHVDGSADIHWDLDSVDEIEFHNAELSHTEESGLDEEPTVAVAETQPGDDKPF